MLKFIMMPKAVIMASDICDGAKITLAFLLSSNTMSEIEISQGKIAEELRKSDGTINKYFRQLEKQGYITLKKRAGYSHKILLTVKSLY